VDLTGRVMEVDRTLNEVKTSLESPMPEVAVKDTIKQAMTGLELVVTVHINSINGVDSDEATDSQYSPALTKAPTLRP
jgi:hypothetical protein